LARALATAPDVLLLDEPLSSLDPAFREEVRRALKDLHQDLGLTFLLVTHDFTEALFLAQRAAVIAAGRLQQTGSVQDIFRSPATPFVAHFVGMKNVLPAAFNGPHARVGNLNVTLDPPLPQHARPTHIGIRPEDVLIGPPGQADGQTNTFPGQVQHVSPHGLFFELGVELNGATLSVITPGNDLIQLELAQGASVSVTLPPSKIHPL
ncbi:MAG: ABC transporter ATP-binding protein, partial [Proteobacteria bacterium]|nr:ABC transporter ATP-binding protein [Pseudomonadota bacterium]